MCTHDLIPDDILELIFVRLDSPVCLIRAATACKRWGRVVASVGFLRHFRSIHGPPIAGTYHNSADSFVPSPSSGIDGRHFSLDFLPSSRFSGSFDWILKDTRAGLVLLERKLTRIPMDYQQELIVCEPLSRQYKIIPPLFRETWIHRTEAFLLDGDDSWEAGDGGSSYGISLSKFRVFYMAFLARGGGCEAGVFTSNNWQKISIHGQVNFRYFELMGHSEGSIYWWVEGGMAVVVDRATANLASFVLWDGAEGFDDYGYRPSVATGRDGKARIVVGRSFRGDVKIFAARQVLTGGSEWVLEKTIRLPAVAMLSRQWQDSYWRFRDPTPAASCQRKGTVFIESKGLLLALDLDSETIEAETVVKLGYPLELPWPPVLRACRQPGTDLLLK